MRTWPLCSSLQGRLTSPENAGALINYYLLSNGLMSLFGVLVGLEEWRVDITDTVRLQGTEV